MVQELNSSKWKWGYDAFVEPEELGFVIPSYYDVKISNINDIQSGPVSVDALTRIPGNYFTLTSGQYCMLGQERTLFPSESITTVADTSTVSYTLSAIPSPFYMPSVCSFKRTTQGIIPSTKMEYLPGSLFESGNDGYKIENKTLTLTKVVSNSYKSIVLQKKTQLSSGWNVFLLPEFPVVSLVVPNGLNDSIIDYNYGIIYTLDDIDTVTCNYITTLFITYVPENYITDGSIFYEDSPQNDTFTLLTIDPEYIPSDIITNLSS